MHYVGIDLAWAERRPSGVAALDDRGRLVLVASRTSDEEILDAVRPYTEGPCLVAFDAPLVVTNATGTRPGERALNKDFRAFDAGAHPTNTGRTELSGGSRALRLARALGLDVNPSSGRARRGIEVYPHPATVALFRLGRVLPYKHKPGRSLGELRDALHRLTELLETLEHADPPLRTRDSADWQELTRRVRDADRKSHLRAAEDEVDAVLCAYVARFVQAHPERTTTYGDLASGYIVTPTLPPDLTPTPRASRPTPEPTPVPAADHDEVVRRAVRAYGAQHRDVEAATRGWTALVTGLLDEAGINYLSVEGRAKSVASFAGKAARTVDGLPLYADPLRQITDQVGIRVVTYVLSDVDAVARLLADQLDVLDDRDMGLATAQQGRFGYASRHVLVRLDAEREGTSEHAALHARPASVQVRTVLQHAWAEFEHDIRYKGTVPAAQAPDLDRRFTLAAGLLELADREFSTIRDRLRESAGEQQPAEDAADPRIGAQDLAAYLAGRFPDAGWSRTEHYAWVSDLLLELGITSLDELGAALADVDSTALNRRMAYRYPPGAVRRLDDALLARYGETYIGLHGNAHRVDALRERLVRLSPP